MARPHQSLLAVAAGRPVGPVADIDAAVESAIEHKMLGLLWDALQREGIEVDGAVERVLAGRTLRNAAHSAALWAEVEATAETLGAAGIEFAVFKGVTNERRWYPRPGTRPASDIDLFIAPHDAGRFGEAVRLLDPGHVLGDVVQRYVDRGLVQSTDVRRPSGIWLDIHADPLKTGLPARTLFDMWSRTGVIDSPNGVSVRVLDPETALIQALLHLQKDRFSYLLWFADVARIVAAEDLAWDDVQRIAAAEGVGIHVAESMRVVADTLGLEVPLPRRGPSAVVWHAIWSEASRLQGDVGMSRKVRTKYWIPFWNRGRRLEALRWWLRLIFPPKRLFAYFHPEASGPHLWRLARVRVGLAWSRHRRNTEQRRTGKVFRSGVRRRITRSGGGTRTWRGTGT